MSARAGTIYPITDDDSRSSEFKTMVSQNFTVLVLIEDDRLLSISQSFWGLGQMFSPRARSTRAPRTRSLSSHDIIHSLVAPGSIAQGTLGIGTMNFPSMLICSISIRQFLLLEHILL